MVQWAHCFASRSDDHLSLPRFGHSAVAVPDADGGCQVVVFGGVGLAAGEATQTARDDVLVLQVDSGTWFAPDVLPAGGGGTSSSPGPRAFHSAVSLGSRVLLFGGHILTYDAESGRKRRCFFNDVWQLDTVDWKWQQLLPASSSPSPTGGSSSSGSSSSSSPPPRDMAALLALDDDRLLLFGGRSEASKAFQDTWLLDLTSNSWQQLRPEGALPAPRKMHSMAKVGSQQVVLFGGERESGPLDDAFVLAGFGQGETLRWTQLRLRSPPAPRFGHAMAVSTPPQPGTSTMGAADGSSSSSDAGEEAANTTTTTSSSSSKPRVVLFGGCLDQSTMLSFNRSYVQSRETWLLELDQLSWVPLPHAAAAPSDATADANSSWPCERMCHSLTPLPNGLVLLFGGRNKDGICRDFWFLDTTGDIPAATPAEGGAVPAAASLPPASPRPPYSSGSSTTAVRPGGSLLQSLLGPMRGGGQQQQQRDANGREPAGGRSPAAAAATPAASTPGSSQPSSPRRQQTGMPQTQDEAAAAVDVLQPLAGSDAAAAVDAGAASGGVGAAAAALVDVSSAELAKLLRNPAAYSASAIGKLGSSVTSTVSSLLVARDGQPGPRGIPAALMRVAPAWAPGALRGLQGGSSQQQQQQQAAVQQQLPGLVALRQQMGLVVQQQHGHHGGVMMGHAAGGNGGGNSSSAALRAPGNVLQELAALGQQLLEGSERTSGGGSSTLSRVAGSLGGLADDGSVAAAMQQQQQASRLGVTASGSFQATGSLPTEVLVAAARQHLMAADAQELRLPQVALLLSDYQQLAASYYATVMLSRLSDGISAAIAAGDAAAASQGGPGGSAFLQRRPDELLLGQVVQLQEHYRRLLLESAA